MRPHSVGRALRLGACSAATAGLVAVATATPAHASDTLWIHAPHELTLPAASGGGAGEGRIAEIGIYHDNTASKVTDGRLTADVSGLAGVAEVSWPDVCEADGTTVVCDFPEVSTDAGDNLDVEVRAAEGAGPGAEGVIRYTATASGGLKAYPVETTVTVGAGPDLLLGDVPEKNDVEPGDTAEVPFSVSNRGNETAAGAILWIHASHGLDFAQRFSNCEYTEYAGGEDPPAAEALCTFDQPLKPGAVYVPDRPLGIGIAGHALYERADLRVEPKSAEALDRARGNRSLTRGGGGTLRLTEERPAPKAADLNEDDNYAIAFFTADNAADFELTGAEAEGAEGATVAAEVRLRNLGPAWVAHLSSGEPVAAVDVRVPEGTTVVKVPSGCSPRGLNDEYIEKPTGAPRYLCRTAHWVGEDASLAFPFELRIDEVVPNAAGRVAFAAGARMPFDPETGNNATAIVVNGDGSGEGNGGTGTGGPGGGDPSDGGNGGTGGAGGEEGADSGTEGGEGTRSAGGSGDGDGSTGGGAGSLALTGAGGIALIGGLAAVAVAVGGGFVLLNRRRARG